MNIFKRPSQVGPVDFQAGKQNACDFVLSGKNVDRTFWRVLYSEGSIASDDYHRLQWRPPGRTSEPVNTTGCTYCSAGEQTGIRFSENWFQH